MGGCEYWREVPEWGESIHLLFAKGKFYFQQFFFTLLWTLAKKKKAKRKLEDLFILFSFAGSGRTADEG